MAIYKSIYSGRQVDEALELASTAVQPGELNEKQNKAVNLEGFTAKTVEEALIEAKEASAESTYTNTTPTPAAIGGIAKGATFSNKTIQQMFDELLYPYVAFSINSFTCTPTAGVYECGNSQNITSFKVNLTKGSSKITKIVIYQGSTQVLAQTKEDFGSGDITLTPTAALTVSGTTTFKVEVTDEKGKTLSKTTTFSFVYPYYYGVAAEGADVNETLIKSFIKLIYAKGTRTIAYTAANQKMIYASPYAVAKITDQNNFNVTDTFTMTRVSVTGLDGTSQSYYVYTANTASTVTNFKMTFAH